MPSDGTMRFLGLLAVAAVVLSGCLAQSDLGERRCTGGVCVPFYLCENGMIVEDGAGLIDKRFADNECPEDYVCCKEKESACKGQCIPFYQCANEGGKDLLNLRSFDDKCPGDLVCCNEPPAEPNPCTCVAFYQCLDDVVNSDAINLRFSNDKCPGDEVCCVNPRPQSNTIIVESSCKGKCVPFDVCPNRTSNSADFNLRAFDDCPSDQVCCESLPHTSIQVPKICNGQCVPFYQCPGGVPNTGGQHLINLRSDESTCPGDQICCSTEDASTKPVISKPVVAESATAPLPNKCKGLCVPSYQCPQGQQNTGGEGLLNLRSFDDCPNDLVCCEATPIKTEVSTKPPSLCDGKCVPFYQCPAGTPNKDGQNILNLRGYDEDSCPGDQVCCKEPVQTPKSTCKGSCVPFYQCPQGQQNTGGKGLLNLRSFDDCPNDLVCCEASPIKTEVSTKPPSLCDGKCVPFYQCPAGSPNKDGQNILNLRGYDEDSCPGDQVCCKEPVQTPKSTCKGSCVPFYQCPQGQLNTGGKGLLNLRSFDDCPNDLVCCEASPIKTEVSTKPPSLCDGKCVPFYQCPAGSPNKDGQNILNLRGYDEDSCPGDQVCCKEPVQTPKSTCKGSCVPFYQCPQGQLNTGGKGLLNLRSFDDCPNDLVCCEATPIKTEVSTKPPSLCDGKCVPFYQCPAGSPNKDGQNILNLRGYDENSCPGDQVCCKEPVQTPKSTCKGSCVPFYQCPQGQQNTGGKGLLNLRSFDDCPNDLVCCESSPLAPKVCQGHCVPSSLCMSTSGGVEDLLNLRISNNACPKNLVCCEKTEIIYMNPHRATWMQWVNDINGMEIIKVQPVQHGECSLQLDFNGAFAEQREVPWLVTVWRKVQYLGRARDDYHCVGTVIRSDVVLVPADCVANIVATELYVRSGNYNLKATDGAIELKVKNINIHPDFDFTNDHANVALLSLQSAVSSPSTACLAKHDEHLSEQNCLLVGWTIMDLVDSDAALPRKNRLNLNGSPSCKLDSLCSAGNTQFTQNCDSFYGSPVICPGKSGQQWKVTGLVTRGSMRCNENAVPETLVKVSSLQPWISEQLSPSFVNKPAAPEPSRKYLPVF